MSSVAEIRDCCRVVSGNKDDCFVGIRVDNGCPNVCFPLGYMLPDDDADLRIDIQNLLGILSTFNYVEGDDVVANEVDNVRPVDFPVHAYLKIIRSFLKTGRYYIEKDQQFKDDTKGYISWSRTFRKKRAMVQGKGSLIFADFVVRSVAPNVDKQITQIHKYCVYEAFDKMGWLYVSFMPEKPEYHPSIDESIYILNKKLAGTHNDDDQELFGAMKDMLEYMDKNNSDGHFLYGTYCFEKVWEGMIDRAFGIEAKQKYYPKTKWLLNYEADSERTPLYPDSIMIYEGKYYVLDAKYYQYGITKDSDRLPNGTDINKQITYGEYIARQYNISNDKLYNAFIMPYNMEENPFRLASFVGNIGEAIGYWKSNDNNFERIQGIVMDTRFLMYSYFEMPDKYKKELADSIEEVSKREPESLS